MCQWMSFLLVSSAICAACLAQPLVPTTLPTTAPALPREIRSEMHWLGAKRLAPRPYNIDELVTFKIENGRLVATAGPAARQFPSETRVQVEGLGGQWTVSSGARSFTLTRYDFDQAVEDGLWRIRLQADDRELTIRGYGGTTSHIGVHLICREHDVFCGVCPNRGRPTFSYTGPSLAAVRQQNPDLVRACVRTMITRMGAPNPFAIPPAAAYRAFANIPADPAVAQRVVRIVSQFESDIAEEREQASRELAALGAPGVLAAMRQGREHLSPEQLARIDEFLMHNDDLRAADVRAALRDTEFLLDCLDFDDIAVRNAAKSALAELLHRLINFDVNAAPQARAIAVDKLWREMAASQPAKQ